MDLDFSYSSGFSENAQFLFSGFLTPQMNFAIHQLIQHPNYEIVPIIISAISAYPNYLHKEEFIFWFYTAVALAKSGRNINSLCFTEPVEEYVNWVIQYYEGNFLLLHQNSYLCLQAKFIGFADRGIPIGYS